MYECFEGLKPSECECMNVWIVLMVVVIIGA